MDEKKPRTGGNRGGVIDHQSNRVESTPTRAGRATAGVADHAPPPIELAWVWLTYTEPRPQQQRATVAFALWDGWGDAAEPLYFQWLRRHPEHDAKREQGGRDTWRSARKPGSCTWRTLRRLAWAGGWRPDPAAPRPPPPTAAELAHQQAERAARAEVEATAKQARQQAAALGARKRLAAADLAGLDHPYFLRKGVAPTADLRQEGRALLVPVCAPDGELRGLQVITADGGKQFSRGTAAAGALWWARPPAGDQTGAVYVVEGVATGLTVAAAIPDAAVAVAFSAHNLPAVVAALRQHWPAAEIIIAADNDANGTGHKYAVEAAADFERVRIRLPVFAPEAQLDGKAPTDFNDLHQLAGLDEVSRQLLAEPTKPPAPNAASEPPTSAPLPDLPKAFGYGEGAFIVQAGGVFYQPPDDAKGREQPARWICGALRVIAQTRDPAGLEWGRLLTWQDPDGRTHHWAAPLELLQGDGAEVRRELARRGLPIAAGRSAHELLAAFIQAFPVETRARCVDRLGWIGGAFVLPDQVVGAVDGGEEVVFQGRTAEAAHAVAGSVDDWRRTVAALALGNSRLVFTISGALAGPLLHLVGGEGGGFHLRGRSSSGKSTAMLAGASVWGPPAFVRPWRATASGLEGVALLHNDGTMFLDELAECDPRQAAEAVYMLANGRGKARAAATGAARPSARWRCLFFSTGETSLEAHAATVGRRIAAGQEVRLGDIEADAAAGMGAFEHLHGHPSPAAFAVAVRDAAAQHYGAAGVAWLRWLVANRAAATEAGAAAMARFVEHVVPPGASGQVVRVARRFGLIAAAGELATRAGLTDWPQGEATHAAQACFAAWLATFGAGDREERAILEQVRAFFEMHGSSRFEDISSDHGQRVPNRAGFYHHPSGPDSVRTFMVLPGVFRNEVCGGLDFKTAVRVLLARGWLAPEDDRHVAQSLRTPGGPRTRLYVFTPHVWEDAADA